MNNRISILVKPTNACNLRCHYCFHEKTGYSQEIMSNELFDEMISKISCEYDNINIVWHGGEPLLVPLAFYESAYKFCSCKNSNIKYSIQTNATLLSDDFLNFFKENDTNIGVSFDGTVNELQRGSTEIVIKKILQARKSGFNLGAIMVVTKNNINRLKDEYDYFKKLGISVKFNPMFTDGAGTHHRELEVSVDDYIEAFTDFFKYWLQDTNCNINAITCHEYIKLILYNRAGVCTYNSCLGNWLCIDASGDIYPCDRLAVSDFRLGNIRSIDKISDVFMSENFINLIKNSISRRNSCSSTCEYYSMCYGGCNASAALGGNISQNTNISCRMHKGIISGIQEVVEKIPTYSEDIVNPILKKIISQNQG